MKVCIIWSQKWIGTGMRGMLREAGASEKSEAKALTLVKALQVVMGQTQLFHGADPSCNSVLLSLPIHRNEEPGLAHAALMREQLSSDCYLYEKNRTIINMSYWFSCCFTPKSEKQHHYYLVFIFPKLTCLTSWTSTAGSSLNCSRYFLKLADSFIRAALWYRESLCPVRTSGSVSPSRMAQIALRKKKKYI